MFIVFLLVLILDSSIITILVVSCRINVDLKAIIWGPIAL